MTRRGRTLIVPGLLLLLVSISLFIWGYFPPRRETRIRQISEATSPVLPSGRSLTLTFPPSIHVGNMEVVRLTLDVATRDPSDPVDFYDSHNLIAEARFDLPGINVRPSELISAPISQGQTAVFYWTLRPNQVGRSHGTIWLYLRSVDKLTGEESRETVSAQIVEIDSVKFLGLSTNQARIASGLGIILGLALSIPFFEARIKDLIQKQSRIS